MSMSKRLCVVYLVLLLCYAGLGMAAAQTKADPVPVTYDEVLKYLKLEVSEDRILKTLENSPTHFTLSEEQRKELRNAGASARLIEAMHKKGAPKIDETISDIALILDVSGSMRETMPGKRTKWDAAQEGAIKLIESVPNGCQLAFIVYGHDAARKCQAVDVVKPLGPLSDEDKTALKRYIGKLKPTGHTPIALALRTAGQELAKSKGLSKVILITDGMETCHGDPELEVAKLREMNNRIKDVDVVGLAINPHETKEVETIAKTGHGKYYGTHDLNQLRDAIKDIERIAFQEPGKDAGKKPTNDEGLSPRVKLLIEQLKDENSDIRREAAKSLGTLKLSTEAKQAVVEALVDRVTNDSFYNFGSYPGCQDTALESLKRLAPDNVEPTLFKAARSKDGGIRGWATRRILELDKK
jgi:Mg-chelatase subunit ChlD